jgi:hypothetical protein
MCPIDFPGTIHADFYRSARPMNGFVNAETGELDPAGTYHPSGIEFDVDKGSLLAPRDGADTVSGLSRDRGQRQVRSATRRPEP